MLACRERRNAFTVPMYMDNASVLAYGVVGGPASLREERGHRFSMLYARDETDGRMWEYCVDCGHFTRFSGFFQRKDDVCP